MIVTLLFAILSLGASIGADVPPRARELHLAGSLLGDRAKLQEAWRLAPRPEIAASLTETWLFELGADLDEELVGTPPFLEVLAAWEDQEPDNALVPCLRELFASSRESRLVDWERLTEAISTKRRIFFHYAPVRKATLGLLLTERGNRIESWVRWLGQAPLTNVGRISRLVQSCLFEARFLLLTGDPAGARRLIGLASRIAEQIEGEDDEVALRKASLAGGVVQEQLLAALIAGAVPRVKELMVKYRTILEEERRILSRLSVIANLHRDLARAYALAYQEIRTVSLNDVASVNAATMAAFAEAVTKEGSKAVDGFWNYKNVPLDDFTSLLERHLDIFQEKELTRAAAGKFMDFLRTAVSSEKGVPTWVIPAFARVRKVYGNAAALGRKTISEHERRAYAWLTGALSFLVEKDGEEAKWLEAFTDGKARPYLLLAFAKHRITGAVPAIIEALGDAAENAPASSLLDYALCLRTLTGQDFGLDPDTWQQWLKSRK